MLGQISGDEVQVLEKVAWALSADAVEFKRRWIKDIELILEERGAFDDREAEVLAWLLLGQKSLDAQDLEMTKKCAKRCRERIFGMERDERAIAEISLDLLDRNVQLVEGKVVLDLFRKDVENAAEKILELLYRRDRVSVSIKKMLFWVVSQNEFMVAKLVKNMTLVKTHLRRCLPILKLNPIDPELVLKCRCKMLQAMITLPDLYDAEDALDLVNLVGLYDEWLDSPSQECLVEINATAKLLNQVRLFAFTERLLMNLTRVEKALANETFDLNIEVILNCLKVCCVWMLMSLFFFRSWRIHIA